MRQLIYRVLLECLLTMGMPVYIQLFFTLTKIESVVSCVVCRDTNYESPNYGQTASRFVQALQTCRRERRTSGGEMLY